MIDLHEFDSIVFFTGAGLSKASGIPTYRGEGGLWHEYNYEDYACQRAFDRDPEKVWDFHDKRRAFIGSKEPNAAHHVITEVQRARPGTRIVTQNIDGLHQKAGAAGITELHGSIWRVRCAECGTLRENRETPLRSRKCDCGTYLRPDIVWFEDPLDAETIGAAQHAIAECDALVSIGTSGVVYPAAALPQIALQTGATLIEINPEETAVSGWYRHHLRGPADEMLRQVWPA